MQILPVASRSIFVTISVCSFLSLLFLLLDPCPVHTLPLLLFFPPFLLLSSVHLSASGSPTTWCYSMTAEWSRFYAKTNLVLWQVSPIAKPQCKYWSNLEKKKSTHWQKQLCTLKSESQAGKPFRIFLSAHCPTGLHSGAGVYGVKVHQLRGKIMAWFNYIINKIKTMAYFNKQQSSNLTENFMLRFTCPRIL